MAERSLLISPYFASVLIICGLALYTARLRRRHVKLCGLGVIGVMTLAWMAPHWSDSWMNGRVQFANLATLLVLFGAGAALLLRDNGRPRTVPPDRRSIAVALLGAFLSVLTAYALVERDILKTHQFAKAAAAEEAEDVREAFVRVAALVGRFGERWTAMGYTPSSGFIEHEFGSYMRDFPFLQRLAVVDGQHIVLQEKVREGFSSGWIEDILTESYWRDWLRHVQDSGEAHVLPQAYALGSDTIGLVVAPLSDPYMRDAFVIATVSLTRLLAGTFTRNRDAPYFRVGYGDLVLYQTTDASPADRLAKIEITIPFHHDAVLRLSYGRVAPDARVGFDILPEFVLLAGVTFTLFLIASQRLAYVARYRSAQLSHSALHDPLTGLPNRRLLEQNLKDACALAKSQGQTVSVVFFDLDGIKVVNDSMGHAVGDKLLVEVASRLQQGTVSIGSVARLGGDEFVVLILGLSDLQVQDCTQRLLISLGQPYFVDRTALRVTASAGITVNDGDVKDPMQLVREADLAMLEAKEEGRNTWHRYTVDMIARVTERLELRNDLQSAMDSDMLQLHYQPIVDGQTGRLTGVEALLRWPHAARGFIPPSRFIPLAEETGQIIPLTEWVLAAACRDSGILRKHGLPPFAVIVNISPLYFQRVDFVEKIRRALQGAALPAAFLEIEITESVLLDNEEGAILKLAELREMGVKTSIDDFGTGYSSLNYLKNLPIDKVKIDRLFVADVVSDPADAAIAQGIISMAHHLDLKVVAEGVETESQFAFLKRNRCDEFQGYLFAQPMSFGALLGMLSENGCRLRLPGSTQERASDRVLLLVDDEKNILNALVRLLRRDGYQILTANGPARAFEVLAQHQVHVVVSDQRMPDMTGTEFFRKVKEMYPDTVRMILSGYTDLKSVTEAVNHGEIYKFITKPWDDEALRREIGDAFKKFNVGKDGIRQP